MTRSADVPDGNLCVILRGGLGRRQTLLVAKFVNADEIRRSNSIPTTLLAFRRFDAAVVASSPDWICAGLLSDVHMALLTRSSARGLEAAVVKSINRYSFEDPFTGQGTIRLEAISVAVGLSRIKTLDALFAQIGKGLQDASSGLPEAWRSEDHTDRWCRDVFSE